MTQLSPLVAQLKDAAWHTLSAAEVLAQLGAAATGLSVLQAAQRLAAGGPNELTEGKRQSPFRIFLGQFKSLIIWILIAAGVLSGVLGEVADAIAILAIVVLNAPIGFYQEWSAEKSISALKKMTAPQAKVQRAGNVVLIAAADVVVGDILALEAGDVIAADGRLLAAAINLVTDGLPALCLATDAIDPDVMNRPPRLRSASLTDRSFLVTTFLTGLLTAGVAFAAYFYVLKTRTPDAARAVAFTVLVFAELLRSFGARSEVKPVWRVPLFTNVPLLLVVAVSFAIQVASQHSATLGRFLKTSFMPVGDCLLLFAVGAIPLLILELRKVARSAWRQRGSAQK